MCSLCVPKITGNQVKTKSKQAGNQAVGSDSLFVPPTTDGEHALPLCIVWGV